MHLPHELCSSRHTGHHQVTNFLRKLPELRFIVTTSAGVNQTTTMISPSARRGITLANASQIFSEDVADLAVGLLIDVLRKISDAIRFVKGEFWPRKGVYPLDSKVDFQTWILSLERREYLDRGLLYAQRWDLDVI